ncbi:MAG: efflux RND transporter periplasmic adaptor subunit [Gammaproteobacteria bacterium]|nr:efflux RND transporter periplasmic adaptor subunit [Gammaproteobacteria bacterium]
MVEALSGSVTPTAEGYGPVRPARVWAAVAQVSGRIVSMHDELGNGSLVAGGTELLSIDPVDYELELARVEAELAELDVRESNTRASLELERRSLALSGARDRAHPTARRPWHCVAKRGRCRRAGLARRAHPVRNLENTPALVPAQRAVLEARRAQALRDIENTVVTAPFDMRVAALAVETGQFVSTGRAMLEGDSVARAEVVAQFSMASIRNLIRDRENVRLSTELLASNLAEVSGFRPVVELDLGNHVARWDARFVRISDAVDAETRTVGLVVAVDDPFGQAIPGVRPPLSKGMFVKVIIAGDPLADRVVVPRHAVRAGAVLVADADDRLRIRDVTVDFELRDVSVLASGLEGGERVVVTDVVPLVEGMLLATTRDDALAARLAEAAGGGR